LTLSSKSQYEGRFREWNLRKNLKRKDWQRVIEDVNKRARIGKESEVRLNGAILNNERVAREGLRYGWTRDSQIEVSEGIYATPYDLVVYISSLDIDSNLPKDVTVCTPPSVEAEDETSQTLHQVSRDPITNQGYYHEHQDHSSQMIGVGTGLWRVTTYGFKPLREQFQPFAWFSTLDWKSIPESMIQSLPPDQEHTPTSTQIAAMFCPVEEITSAPKTQYNHPAFNGSTTAIQYSMASILNKSDSSTFDPYHWLRGIPWPIAARIFGGLPAPIRDVFRERIFAEAIMNDNETLVKAVLELGIDPLERIDINGRVETPPVYAAKHERFLALKVLILHMIKANAKIGLESLLPAVVSAIYRRPNQGPELLRLILSSGAKPTSQSFEIAANDRTLWNELMETQENGIYGWIQTSLFIDCVKSLFDGSNLPTFFDRVTEDLLRTNAGTDFVVDDKVEAALSDAFEFFISAGLVDRAQALFEICVTIQVRLLYPTSEGTSGNDTIAQACRSMDLDLLRKWTDDSLSYKLQCASSSMTSGKPEQAVFARPRRRPEVIPKSLYQAVLNDDLSYIESEIHCPANQDYIQGGWGLVLCQAARLGRDNIALAVLQHPNLPADLDGIQIYEILEHGRIHPLSEFVCFYPHLRHALFSATTESNYDSLDDLLRQSVSFFKPRVFVDFRGRPISYPQIDERPNILLGALAYYAIHHDDSKLLGWLLEFGLEVYCHFSTAQMRGNCGQPYLPPLLGIAAAHNKTQVLRYLFEREGKDSLLFAMSWLVRSQASEESTSTLLNELESPETSRVVRSHSTPLLHAIRNRNYNLVRRLAQSADVNYIVLEKHESSRHDDSFSHSSPMGEAVSRQDLEATTILLENGGNPNMLAVLWKELPIIRGETSSDGAFLARTTSIIAAIDTKSLLMVQLLVQSHSNTHGLLRSGLLADINHPPRLGLLRTPLQRAAETGCFDIVRYLVEQGAEIDLAPCYGGGTALQLAAMQGHVGIAAFLLERGADANFPPARGPGRTAFEAAAEWNRIDMLSLLMKWGCRLEIDIANDPDERPYNHLNIPYYYPNKRYGEDSDGEVETDQHRPPRSTQYERAMRFAKNSGHMACKRFIEHLYQQCAESTPEGYWDPESFTNAEQDLDWDADFWRQFGLDI
jgi:ankyrin repeat protein